MSFIGASMAHMGRIASFHLVRERPGRSVLALGRLAFDRPRLASTDGLVFSRVLGTGSGNDTGPSADLRRTALFALWEDADALDAFEATSTIAARWPRAEESWHVRLRSSTAGGRSGHGSWRGVDVLDGLEPGDDSGPVAVITRADVRMRTSRPFRASSRRVSRALSSTDGLLAVVGIGEAPIARLGTFSLWRDRSAMRRFVVDTPAHREAVRRTREDHWYGEELFARFEPYASRGSWDGVDPLAGFGRHGG